MQSKKETRDKHVLKGKEPLQVRGDGGRGPARRRGGANQMCRIGAGRRTCASNKRRGYWREGGGVGEVFDDWPR
ncbi:hypothetical protein MY11210_005752 [Beauveria gryllotalpidicola]